MDHNRLVQDQAVRSGARTGPGQDQKSEKFRTGLAKNREILRKQG